MLSKYVTKWKCPSMDASKCCHSIASCDIVTSCDFMSHLRQNRSNMQSCTIEVVHNVALTNPERHTQTNRTNPITLTADSGGKTLKA